MTNQERLRELQKSLDIDNILLAEAFIETNLKQLKIRKNTKLYVAAVDFIASKIKRGENIVSKRDLTQLQKDEANKTAGAVHKKLKTQFENIVKLYAITVDPTPVNQRISSLPNPNPSPTNQNPARKPEVKLTSNIDRVAKGGTVTLTWTSKNATKIKRTNIPGVRANQLNGTIDVPDIRRRRDFYIIVESADRQSAEDKVTTLIETQRFLQGRDDPPSQSQRQQRQTAAPPVSGSGGTSSGSVEEDKEPVIETRSNSLNDDILSSIDKSLENIHKILKSQLKLNENVLVTVRRLSEEERRQLKEEEMEKGGLKEGLDMMKDAGKKILSPFKEIIDKIVRFIFFTFLGKAFTEIVKWFNDPQNKDKVEAMGRFLKDFWPLIAGAAVLFLTPLGGFIVGTVKFLVGTVKTLKALGKIIKTLRQGKVPKPGGAPRGGRPVTEGRGGTAIPRGSTRITGDVIRPGGIRGIKPSALIRGTKIAATAGLDIIGEYFIGKGLNKLQDKEAERQANKINSLPLNERKTAIENISNRLKKEKDYVNSPGHTIDKITSLGRETQAERNIRFLSSILNKLGEVTKYNAGGKIFDGLVTTNDGIKISGAGKDTQMFPVAGGGAAVLQPGELVLQPKAVNKLLKLGIDPLALNEGPGANKPKKLNSSNISLMNTGGVIGEDQRRFIQRAIKRGITDPKELAAFMSQVHVEQGGVFSEPRRELYNTHPDDPPGKPGYRYFAPYANPKFGLGNRNTDDAYNYMGRGYLQITGRNNYADIGKRIGVDLLKNPGLLKTDKDISMDAAIEYWKSRVRPGIKNNNWGDVLNVSRLVNNPSAKSSSGITHFNDRVTQSRFYSSLPPSVYMRQKPEKEKPKPQPGFLQQAGQFFGGIGNKIRGLFTPKKKQGGLVSSSSGETLEGKPSDGILSRLEKGEYVIPKMAVALIGTDLLDRVSALDPNSEAYSRVSRMELNIATPRPLSRSMPQMSTETLPPIMQGGYGGTSGGYGTPIPPIAPNSSQEQAKAFNASILGII
jgi:predicted chitinase